MTEITDFNFAEDEFTAADLAKFKLLKSEEVGVLNSLAELLNKVVAAKVLKLSQDKDEFYNHAPCGYFSTAENGIINKINDTLLVWLGYAKEDIIGKVTWQSLLSAGGKIYFETHYSPLLQMQGFVQEISFEMVRKDKTRLPILINTKQIRDENGIMQINYSTVFDVSQRKSYEKELLIAKRTVENQNEFIEYTFRNASIPIYYVLEDGSMYDFNDIAAENLGYTSEELRALKIYDLDKNYDEKKWVSVWAKLKAKKKITIETQHKKKDGTPIDLIITANYVKYGDLELKCSYVQDITEKKKIEEKLKLSAFTIDNAAWGLAYVKADGTLYNCNLAFAKLYGSNSVEEMKTKTSFDFGRGYTPETWKQYWDELKQKKTLHYIVKRTKKDGTIIDLEINADMIQFGDLELNCISINDITEKKKTEAEIYSINELLQRQTNRLLLATKSAQLGIWEWDLKNNMLTWDEGMYRLYNIAENEFNSVYEEWFSRLHPEDIQQLNNDLELALANKKEYKPEFRIVWKDSSVHYINSSAIIERDDDGNAIRMIGTNWDVTEEKENMRHLKLLESVIVNTKDSILITEAEPFDEPGPRILFVNPAFEKMTGYTSEEVIGLTPRLLQNEDTDRKELDKFRAALNKWEPCEITISNSRKNGEKFWNNFSVVPVANEKGWYTHWIAVERDVTKEKEAEEEKETLLNELVKSNLELKQFSYITTHNLRAPLTNLVSICDIIQPGNGTDALTVQLIDAFKTSTHHLNETLNDLIEILIIKDNRNIQKDQLTFEEIFKKTTESLSLILLEKQVIFNADFSAAPSVIFTNAYLESVFLNLITNAIKYGHPERNPIITIRTSKEPNGNVKLTFSDNGIGMNMALAKDKIFGLYKKFHKNTDSKGIGLYLIHSQITSLGGKIEVESELNIGTTFTIFFK